MKKFLLALFVVLFSFQTFSQTGCPEVTASEDVSLDCTNNCTTLNATYLDVGRTNIYEVEAIDYNPPFPFDAGTPTNINEDDLWSSIINLPFEFCFFDENYTQLVVGANGIVSFNTEYANDDCPYDLEGPGSPPTPKTIPGENFQHEIYTEATNSIYGAFHDIDITATGATADSFRYGIVGEEPCRAFVVNFFEIPHFSCNSLRTTQQIVLYENTNAIDVYIRNKPICNDWNSGFALVGIQNDATTEAYTPPGRNTGEWEAVEEAWRFTPSGESAVQFSWLDGNGEVVSNDPSFQVCPFETTEYTAQVIYDACDGTQVIDTDTVLVTVEENGINIEQPENIEICDDDGVATFDLTTQTPIINNTNNPDLEITYHITSDDAANGENPIPTPDVYENTSNPQTIYVGVLNSSNSCRVFVQFDLIVNQPAEFNEIEDYQICDTDGDGTADFDLESLIPSIQVNASDVVTFHLTQEDAISGDNPLSSPYTNTSNPQTIYIRIDNGTGCFTDTPYSFDLIVGEQPTANTGASLSACSLTGTHDFNLSELDSQITTDNTLTITYHATEAHAEAGAPELSNPYTANQPSTTIWVRVENAEGCFAIVSAELIINETPNPTLENMTECASGASSTFNLDNYLATLQTNNPGIDFSIHETEAEAESGTNPLTGDYVVALADSPKKLWVRMVNQSATECTNENSFQLIIQDEPAFNTIDDFELCDDNGDGVASFDLDSRIDDIRINSSDVVTFHDSMQDAEDGTDPLSSPYENTSNPQTIYVRIVSASGCELATPYTFNLVVQDQPEVIAGQSLSLCSINTTADFDLSQLDDDVTPNSANTVTYHETQAEAEAGTPVLPNPYTTGSTTIWARVENAEGCFDIVSVELIVNATPNPTLENMTECGAGANATFDLDEYLTELQDDNPGIDFSIHETEAEAESGANPLTGNYTVALANSPVELWVRMINQSATECTNENSFQLIIEDEPTANQISAYELCDTNNDGVAAFDLESQIDNIRTNATDVVTFHLTPEDAENGADALSSPYENVSNPQTIYVRIVSAAGCELTTPYSFDIAVLGQPDVIAGQSLSLCSPDGSASFNLSLLDDNVTPDATNTVTYHATQADAEAGTPELSNPFSANQPTTTIWVRVQNADGCFDTVSADLNITTEPNIALDNFEQCETTVGSGVATFNFDAYLANLQATYPSLVLSIHPTEQDADDNTAIVTGSYTNTNNPETFWVRVIDPASPACNGNFSFDLVVNSLPVLATGPFDLSECQANDTGTAFFTLTEANNLIAPTGGYTFTYHSSLTDAEAGENPLTDDYESANNGMVWARIMTSAGCFQTAEVNLLVIELPTANDFTAPGVCAQTSVGTFDLTTLVNGVTGGAAGVTVTFHATEADATNGSSPLPASYDTATTTIYARVQDDTTGCFDVAEVALEVIVAPNTTINSFAACENENTGIATFNLEELRNQIATDTGGTVTLHTTEADAESGAGALTGGYSSSGETIWASITTTLVDCDGIRPVTLTVNAAPRIQTFDEANCRLAENPYQFTFDDSEVPTGLTYRVYDSFANADNATGTPVSFPYTATSDLTELYVRIENSTGCHSVSTLTLLVTDFIDNPLEPIVICYGDTYTLPNGFEIPTGDGQYTYQNGATCTNDIYTFDFQVCNPEVYCRPRMPNAFSPNASTGNNDVFRLLEPLGCSLTVKKITIFNRWGEVVYTSDGNNFVWDGVYNGEQAQQGVYLWTIDYSWIDDQGNEGEQEHSGSVFILR